MKRASWTADTFDSFHRLIFHATLYRTTNSEGRKAPGHQARLQMGYHTNQEMSPRIHEPTVDLRCSLPTPPQRPTATSEAY